jgi:hypothetical protein
MRQAAAVQLLLLLLLLLLRPPRQPGVRLLLSFLLLLLQQLRMCAAAAVEGTGSGHRLAARTLPAAHCTCTTEQRRAPLRSLLSLLFCYVADRATITKTRLPRQSLSNCTPRHRRSCLAGTQQRQ